GSDQLLIVVHLHLDAVRSDRLHADVLDALAQRAGAGVAGPAEGVAAGRRHQRGLGRCVDEQHRLAADEGVRLAGVDRAAGVLGVVLNTVVDDRLHHHELVDLHQRGNGLLGDDRRRIRARTVLDAVRDRRMLRQHVPDLTAHHQAVGAKAGAELDFGVVGLDVLDRGRAGVIPLQHAVAGRRGRNAGDVDAGAGPYAGTKELRRPIDFAIDQRLLTEPKRGVAIHVERLIRIGAGVVVDVLVQRPLLREVVGRRIDPPAAARRFGAGSPALEAVAVEVGARVDPITIGLLLHGDVGEHLIGHEAIRLLHVGDRNVGERYAYVDV